MTAWATLKLTGNVTGWSELHVGSRDGEDDLTAAFGAGYVEGALTTVGNWQQLANYIETTFNSTADPLYIESSQFLEANDAFMRSGCHVPKPEWRSRCLVWAQLDGLIAGHQAHAAPQHAMSRLDFLFVNALVDLSSLIHKPFAMADWTAERAARHTRLTTHCSAIVKLSADGRHLWTSHNTWTGYITMLRLSKTYSLPFRGAAAQTVLFSGYYATLSSQDDFFVLSPGLVVQETTNGLYNRTMAEEIVPHSTLTWVRSIVANREATDGASWVAHFSANNSGTINNQWMVVDYNKFSPGEPLRDGTLTILEQWPRLIQSIDATRWLRVGHWQSFNKPFFAEGFALSGNALMQEKYGNGYSYELNPRAKIFRRDASKIDGRAALRTFMRYNAWQTDPLSVAGYGGPGEGPSAENAIAARDDLIVNTPRSTAKRKPFGNTDAKFVDEADVRAMRFEGISGPTHQTQPVFAWSGEWAAFAHHGQPAAFGFGWVNLTATA